MSITFFLIFFGLVISIALFEDEKMTEEENRQRDIYINRNIQAFYETEDNIKGSAIDNISGSDNPLWTNPNVKPGDLGGNFEVVYGKLTQQEKWYLEDIVELVNMANEAYGTNFDVGHHVGVALSESTGSVIKIGGVNLPMFIKGEKSLDNYKKGDLMKAPGVDTIGKYHGHFQVTKDALESASKVTGMNIYDVKNQFFAFTNVYASKFKIYDGMNLTSQEKYILANMTYNLWEYHPNKNELQSILPDICKLFLEPSITNTIIKENIGETDKEGFGKRLVLLEDAYNEKYKDKFVMVVTTNGGSSKNNGIVKEYSKLPVKEHEDFPIRTSGVNPSHPRLIFHPIGDESKYILSFYHGAVRHGLNAAKISYYTQLVTTMINNSNGMNTVQPKINEIQSSIYYNEYEDIHINKETRGVDDLALQTYKSINNDTMSTLLNNAEKDNNLTTGSIGEVGWKDGYPIFKQSSSQQSANVPMTFNGRSTTLADAGCSIYSLTSMLHEAGLGTTPIPNSSITGLNTNGLLDPRELAKVVDAPIIPSKIEKLGYTVEQLPMNTKEDIYNMISEVRKGKSYMVNTKVSEPIKAKTPDGKDVYRRFTNSGHFIIISNAFEIDGELYFEVIDSISKPGEELDSNRLYYNLDDAIEKNALGRSSSGGVVPAFRVTGISKPDKPSLTAKIEDMIDTPNKVKIKDNTVVDVRQSGNSYEVFIMLDNVNYIKYNLNNDPKIKSGIYSNLVLDIPNNHNFILGQYIAGKYKDFIFDINNYQSDL